MNFSRIARKYVDIPLAVTLADGSPASVASVDVALLAPRATPTDDTVWMAVSYDGSKAQVLIAGPDADGSGALALPTGGADLWARVTDSPEIDAARIGRISVS